MFNTVSGKKLAVLGFAYKKNTSDTRFSAAIDVCKALLAERAALSIFDPRVAAESIGLAFTDAAGAEQLLKLHGPNQLEVEGAEPLWQIFLAQFDDRLVQILLCVAALSYALAYIEGEANGWVEPAVILGILLLNAFVGTWQERSAQSASSPSTRSYSLLSVGCLYWRRFR